MSSMLDRLRRLHSVRPQHKPPQHQPAASSLPLSQATAVGDGALENLVPGREIENDGGFCYVSRQVYPLDHVRGAHSLGDLLTRTPIALAPLYPAANLDGEFDFAHTAFIDTETSGLGGGAGVYAFMVGVGTFEAVRGEGRGTDDGFVATQPATRNPQLATHFVVHQFFMRHPGEEGALLVAVAEALARCTTLVTFNGRTFDVPLLRGRYSLNRPLLPARYGEVPLLAEETPHLDLLHPARRLWRRRLQSCSLGNLERQVLRWQRSDDDVPGSLIPGIYLQYTRTGHAGQVRRVFYHNQEDILSMVALAEQLCRHYAGSQTDEEGDLAGMDLLALAQCYEQMERLDDAEAAYRQALDSLAEPAAQAEAFFGLGRLLKRQERWSEATAIWQDWLTTVPGPDPTPYVELAKYCEWQVQDWEQAEMWTGWALHNQRSAPVGQRSPEQIAGLEHRLQRVQAKRRRNRG